MLHLLETQLKEANFHGYSCLPTENIITDRRHSQMCKKFMQIIWMQFVFHSCVFLLRNPIWMEKQMATRQLVIYLLKAFLQLERPLCYCLLSLLLFVMNL